MNEFLILFEQLSTSGCIKKQTAAGTYVDGVFIHAVNFCEYQGENCPRLNLPSGQGYDLCKAQHAEANLARMLRAKGQKSDGVVWLAGHYWICEPCASVLKEIGATELRSKECP